MIYLPDTNTCIAFLRQRNTKLISRWQASSASDIALCSIVVYELRYGAERSSNPAREHVKLDSFLLPYPTVMFDNVTAGLCAQVRLQLVRAGLPIGPHDLQIAAIALQHGLTIVTPNTREFSRVAGLKLEDWET
jgi:tRNA(fMet)-specific endonuclease VapC